MTLTTSHLAPPFAPFTLRQNQSPGWETPWAPIPRPDEAHIPADSNVAFDAMEQRWANEAGEKRSGRMGRRRKAWKTWLLTNSYVPLVRPHLGDCRRGYTAHDSVRQQIIRLLNITFTTATLAIAITIRRREKENNLIGAVGSSPILAIIFAPPTLVHVMAAVYVRPHFFYSSIHSSTNGI